MTVARIIIKFGAGRQRDDEGLHHHFTNHRGLRPPWDSSKEERESRILSKSLEARQVNASFSVRVASAQIRE
jgi:hypothetical protein